MSDQPKQIVVRESLDPDWARKLEALWRNVVITTVTITRHPYPCRICGAECLRSGPVHPEAVICSTGGCRADAVAESRRFGRRWEPPEDLLP